MKSLLINKSPIPGDKIIYEPIDRVIIAENRSRLKNAFKYYGNIYDKRGFHEGIAEFIRVLKRSLVFRNDKGLSPVAVT